MATPHYLYQPDYAVPPGWVLEERLLAHGLSQAEFARRCGRSEKLISEIINGKAPVEPQTALQFEKVLGTDASLWLGLETSYQLFQARKTEETLSPPHREWYRSFPIADLIKRGAVAKPRDESDGVQKLLTFFGVASIAVWRTRYECLPVSYRHSTRSHSDVHACLVWLRLGELAAGDQECAEYDESRFRKALTSIRPLTRKPVPEVFSALQSLCNGAGVALVQIAPLSKMAASGAARWLTPHKALIQLSGRYKTDDHFWFSFFHEAAHLLLHSKKKTFMDADGYGRDEAGLTSPPTLAKRSSQQTREEKEADEWAGDFLIHRPAFRRLALTYPLSKETILRFAEKEGIAPGIVVGRLQHEGTLPWTHLNGLKRKVGG